MPELDKWYALGLDSEERENVETFYGLRPNCIALAIEKIEGILKETLVAAAYKVANAQWVDSTVCHVEELSEEQRYIAERRPVRRIIVSRKGTFRREELVGE